MEAGRIAGTEHADIGHQIVSARACRIASRARSGRQSPEGQGTREEKQITLAVSTLTEAHEF